MIPWFCLAVLQGEGQSQLTPLSDTVRPVDPLPELRGAPIISRNGYTLPGSPKVGRVYRYSVQGSFDGFFDALQKSRPAKDGWKVEERTPFRIIYSREVRQGPLAMQSFMIQNARIVADPKGRVGIRVIPNAKAPGWVWISYNEHVRTRKP